MDSAGVPQFLEVTASPGITETSVILLAMREIGLAPATVFAELARSVFQSPSESPLPGG